MTATLTVIELDPAEVEVDPNNARQRLDGIAELAESIVKTGGNIIPVLVERTENGHRLIAGHRRRAACEAAGVPLKGIETDGDQAAALLALVENTTRQDLSLTEKAAAVQRVLDLGLSEEDVARATGSTGDDVAQIRAIHASKAARDAIESYPTLTLVQAAALAEFDDDPETLKELAETAAEEPGYFDHTLAARRRDKAEMDKAKADLAVFTGAGMPALDAKAQETATSIALLADGKGKNLTARGHRACPGNAVGIVRDWRGDAPKVTVFCTDPEGNGHQRRTNPGRPATVGKPAQSDEERAKASEARRAVISNNRALDTANGVRREYLKGLLARKATIAGLPGFLAEQFLRGHASAHPYNITAEVWAEITGKKVPSTWPMTPADPVLKAARTDREYLVALLGMVAAYHESTTEKTAWRQRSAGRAHYIAFLEGTGYTLTDQEKMIVAEGAKDR